MEQAIKLAIEGGWRDIKKFPVAINKGYIQEIIENDPAFMVDPLFWQALGKALGWENKQHPHARLDLRKEYDDDPLENNQEGYSFTRIHTWNYHALRFFELKLTGGDEEKFWKELLTKQL